MDWDAFTFAEWDVATLADWDGFLFGGVFILSRPLREPLTGGRPARSERPNGWYPEGSA